MAYGSLADTGVSSGPPAQSSDDVALQQITSYLSAAPKPEDSDSALLSQITSHLAKVQALPDAAKAAPPINTVIQAEIAQQEQNGRKLNDNEKFAIADAVRRSATGGPSGIQTQEQIVAQQAQEGAKDNTFLQNVGQPVAQAMAAPVVAGVGLVSPKTAVGLQQGMDQAYAPAEQGSAGQIVGKGIGLGLTVAQMAAMTPAAAASMFALQGAGQARTDVEARRQQGQDISAAQEWMETGGEAVIQGLLAHYLGKIANGTGSIPLGKFLPASVIKAMQTTDGSFLMPTIARVLARTGEGAGVGTVQQIASNLLGMTTGVTPERGALTGTGEAAATGAFMAGLGQGIGEVRQGPELNVAKGQEAPSSPFTGEDVSQPGTTVPESNTRQASVGNPFSGEPDLLPKEDRLAENPEFTGTTKQLQQQAAESDKLVQRVNELAGTKVGALESPEGKLPENTDLRTGQPEHPLLTRGRQAGFTVQPADVPEALRADVEAIQKHTNVDLVPADIAELAGYAHPTIPNAVAFDASRPRESLIGVLGHEITHTFQQADPEANARLVAKMPKAYADRLWNQYKNIVKKNGLTVDESRRDSEVVAEAVRDSINGNGVLKRTIMGDKSLWTSFRAVVEKVLNAFTAKGRFINELDDTLRKHFEIKAQVAEHEGGIEPLPGETLASRGKRIAQAYEALKHEPENPAVKKSYGAFRDEAKTQFEDLQKQGVKVEPWKGEGQPYKSSAEMRSDVQDKKHLWVFTGGDIPADHPLAAKSGIGDFRYNDLFRAVHAYYGHAVPGVGFGPKGEEAAYQAHSKMFSKEALPAMTTETRGQNSWVNFGPKGEENRANPEKTTYAEQKAALLPPEFYQDETQALPKKARPKTYLDIGHHFRNDKSEDLWWQDEDGVIQNIPVGDIHMTNKIIDQSKTHYDVGAEDAEFRGRIDHKLKEISVTSSPGTEINPYGDRRQIAVAKRLESKFPGYKVFIGGKGGMTPVDEAIGQGDLLPKLVNIRHSLPEDKPVGEKIIDAVNSISPKSAVKFAASIETGFKKAVFDRNEPLWRMARSTPPGFVSKLSNLDLPRFVRTVFGFGRYEKMTAGGKGNEFAGLRDSKGMRFEDPETKQGLTRYWLFDPIAKEAAKGKTSSRELLTFADDARVAETTLERGDNLVRWGTAKALREKVAQIMASLPSGKKVSGKGTGEPAEGPVEEGQAVNQDAEKATLKEFKKTKAAIAEAKQHLADLMEQNKAESRPVGEGPAPAKAQTPAAERLAKAQDGLGKLEAIAAKWAKGGPIEPADVFNANELAQVKAKALDRPLTGIGKTEAEPVSNAVRDMAEARRFLDEARKDPMWDSASEYNRRNRLWENSHMEVAVESGLLSEDSASKILQSHERHADLHRVMEDSGVLPPLTKGEAGKYHEFRGSNREIDSPTANMLQTTERLYRAADENLAKRMVLEHAASAGGAMEVKQARADAITIKENGEVKHYQVDPEIAKAVEMWKNHSETAGIFKKILRAPGLIKLYANIMSPIFSATHLARQTFNRVALSQEGGALNLEGIRASMSMFSPKYKQMLDVLNGTMGGTGDFRTSSESYHKLVSKTLAELDGKPNTMLMMARTAWAGYHKIGEWSDAANRIAEFKLQYDKARARGMDEGTAQQYAAAKSRELCDFAVSGTIVKAVNDLMYIPFIKAEMQGSKRLYELGRNKPRLAMQRALIYGLAPALAPILYAMSQGKKELDEYLDRDLTHRSLYNIFKIGGMDLFIPTGQSQYPAKALVELLFDKHPDAKRFREAVMASGLVPRPVLDTGSILPFSGIRESQANYDPFFGKTIVPPEENNAALDLRHVDSASTLSKMLSDVARKAGMEMDPRKIDHILSQDIGGLANVAKSVSDLGKPGLPASTKAATLTGTMRLPPGYSAESFQTAMQKAQYYEDVSSPQYKDMQAKMGASFDATNLDDRNARVDEARTAAEKLNGFYEKHGDALLAYKEATQKVNAAQQAYKDLDTAAKRQAWAQANPEQLNLVRLEPSRARIATRVGELRKALLVPNLPPDREALIGKELDRLMNRLAELTGQLAPNKV